MNDIVRPVSRLPRPIVSDRSRTRAVHPPADYSSSNSLPLIDVRRQQPPSRKRTRRNSVSESGNSNSSSSSSNNNSDMLFQESISTKLPTSSSSWQDRMSIGGYRRSTPTREWRDRRPQTSSADASGGAAYRHPRKTSSGKMHILKKMQTLSLGNEDRDFLGTATFARFQPLPAIERPASAAMITSQHQQQQEQQQQQQQQPDSLQQDLPSEAAVATMSRTSSIYGEELRPISSISEVHGPPSANLRTCRPDSGVVRDSLVRSRTYDIIPTIAGNWIIQEEEDDELDEAATAAAADAEAQNLNSEMVVADGERLLLAIRSPSEDEGDQIYGYFNREDKVETILNFIQEVTGVSSINCGLSYNDDEGEQRHLNLESTIGDTAITNRTVLNIVRSVHDGHLQHEQMEDHSELEDTTT